MLGSLRIRFQNWKDSRKQAVDTGLLQQAQVELLTESTPDLTYFILTVGSCAIVTFGLLSNSAAVIIGAMIIAPLMLPIRGVAFGALRGDVQLIRRGAISLALGTLVAISLACMMGWLVNFPHFDSEILARSKPTLLDLGIAVAAGGISGYAKIQPKVSASLAGTAIAVALMPPVCVIGLGASQGDWSLSQGATLLYLTNLLGITLSCMLAFLLAGYAPLKRAQRALIWTVLLTAILLIPLGFSFAKLVQQARLEVSLKEALLSRTLTFQRVELLRSNTNWLTDSLQVRLSVRAQETVTPKQVKLLEEFVSREMGQSFTLIFEVSQVEEVRA